MRKLVCVLSVCLIISIANAQVLFKSTRPLLADPSTKQSVKLSPVVVNPASSIPTRNYGDKESVWVNFAAELVNYEGVNLATSGMPLFLDTNVLVRYLDIKNGHYIFTYDYANWCSVGEAFTPYSDYIEDIDTFGLGTSYTVDSIAFWYIYDRFGNNSKADSLICQAYSDSKIDKWTYNSDHSPAFGIVNFDRTLKQGKNADFTYRMPLTSNDTTHKVGDTRYFETKAFAVNPPLTLSGGQSVAYTMTYKSGIPYVLNDTIPYAKSDSVQVNYPLNLFMCSVYFDQASPVTTVKEYNNGMVINSQNRYSDYTSGTTTLTGGGYLPGAWWPKPWYLYCWFKISYTIEAGINDLSKDINIQLYPNPVISSQDFNVKFNLTSEKNVNIELYDIVGHKITTMTNEKYSAGQHIVSMPVANIASGIYVCKVNVDNTSGSFKIRIK